MKHYLELVILVMVVIDLIIQMIVLMKFYRMVCVGSVDHVEMFVVLLDPQVVSCDTGKNNYRVTLFL